MSSRSVRRTSPPRRPVHLRAEDRERITAFALAFEHAPVGAALFTYRGGFTAVAVNPKLCEMLGYREDELIDGDPRAVTHPDDWETDVAHARRMLAGELDHYSFEKRFVRKDGTIFRGWLHVTGLRDDDRKVTHIVAFAEDIEAQRRDKERFEAAAMVAFDAFVVMHAQRDRDGNIIEFRLEYANEESAREAPVKPEDLVGRRLADVVLPQYRERMFEECVRVVEQREPIEGEIGFQLGGEERWARYQIVAVGTEGVAFAARDVSLRFRALQALQKNEERLAAIVGHAQDAIVVNDANRRISWVSSAITAICGYAPEDMVGTRFRDLVHPDDLTAFDLHAEHVETRDQPDRVEVRVRHADGHWLWTENVAMNLDAHPAVRGVVAHLRDVTDRKQSEEALRASEKRFRALVQNASDLVRVYDEQFNLEYASPSHEALLGYTTAEMMEVHPRERCHPDDSERLRAAFRLVRTEPKRAVSCEYRFKHKDGSWRVLVAQMSNLLDDPAVRGIVVNLRDVTEAVDALDTLRQREQWFRSIVQHSWDLVSVLERDGAVSYLSPSHAMILGFSIAECWERQSELVHPDDRATAVEAFLLVQAEPGAHTQRRYRLRHADGSWHWFEGTYTNLLHDPVVHGIVVNSRDVTEANAALRALQESEERFATLVRYSSDVVLVTNRGDAVHYVSPAISYVLGYDENDFAAQTVASYVHPDDRALWEAHVEEVLEYPGREHTLELRFRHADGRWRWMEAHAVNLIDDRSVSGIVVHLHDISERRVAETELEHQALHDPLTGLPNRALMLDRLGVAIARGTRFGLRTVVLFIDVDRFKVVNDSLGHAYGDDLLVAMAARLRASLRETDTVARLGGDEFVVLLEDLPHETIALEVAEKILEGMRRPFHLAGREIFVTVSIGLSLSQSETDTAESMIRDADAAMYVAKGRGRNRLEVFDETIRIRVVRHLEMENDLHRALERGELRLVYQPAYQLHTNTIVGVEALLRWDHPSRGLVLPGEFIGVAEETGLITDIGRWIIDEACRHVSPWRDGTSLRTLWVNLSARQLATADLPRIVADALERHHVPDGALGLELTESTLFEDAEAARSMLREVEKLGVRLAIDDFGTGYSSLLYLQRYHVDLLKIDRSFVSGLGTNADDTAITSAVISLGHELGMEVSAEGVETPVQLERLRELGCDSACGYLLVRPTTPETITELLRSSAV